MLNIETCLNCLNDIDEQTLYAEGMVLSSHIMWSDKVSMVLEALQSSADTEDCEEFIQEAKSVGTGITISKGDSLLKRVWDFIRRLVRSIINKISDVLTKLKIRNYEYIEIPMDKSLVEKDLDTINSIYTDLAMDILGTLIDSMSSDNDTKYDTDKVNKLIQRVSTLNILKGIDDGKRHGVKPNEFMTLRDKIRHIDKSSKELLKRTETILKDIERKSSEKNPANPKETEFMKKVQKLATDVSNATTKLFASFKFGSINKTRKMDKEVDVKIKNLKNLADKMHDSLENISGVHEETYHDINNDESVFMESSNDKKERLKEIDKELDKHRLSLSPELKAVKRYNIREYERDFSIKGFENKLEYQNSILEKSKNELQSLTKILEKEWHYDDAARMTDLKHMITLTEDTIAVYKKKIDMLKNGELGVRSGGLDTPTLNEIINKEYENWEKELRKTIERLEAERESILNSNI